MPATRAAPLGRISRLSGWLGLASVVAASGGGLLTEAQSFTRFLGIAVMMVGAFLTVAAYLIPMAAAARTRALAAAAGGPEAPGSTLPA